MRRTAVRLPCLFRLCRNMAGDSAPLGRFPFIRRAGCPHPAVPIASHCPSGIRKGTPSACLFSCASRTYLIDFALQIPENRGVCTALPRRGENFPFWRNVRPVFRRAGCPHPAACDGVHQFKKRETLPFYTFNALASLLSFSGMRSSWSASSAARAWNAFSSPATYSSSISHSGAERPSRRSSP